MRPVVRLPPCAATVPLWSLVVGVSCLSCASSGSTGPSDASTAASDAALQSRESGAEPEASDARASDAGGSECNAVANVGDRTDSVLVAAYRPALNGGAIADGTWVLTAQQIFVGTGGTAGPTGTWTKRTLVISAGKAQIVTAYPDGKGGELTKFTTETYQPSGAKLGASTLCPSVEKLDLEYEASATSLRIAKGSTVFSYTKL